MKNIQRHICFGLILLIVMGVYSVKASASMLLKKVKYNYLLSLPENYYQERGKRWPVIFYLHGSSACGSDIKKIQRYGLPFYLSNGKKIDFIVVSPQCPNGKNWLTDDWFNPVYDEVAAKFKIDESRVYLVGMSLGGFGTWALANRWPNRFAAISPMCAGAQLAWVENLSRIPTWIFHGTADSVVSFSRSAEMAHALKTINSNLRFSRLIQYGHDISAQFNNDALYIWLKQFTLEKLPFWEEPLPCLKRFIFGSRSVSPPLNTDMAYIKPLTSPGYPNNP
ncbi:MAG TPA: alpha/beta hydrolase-fold protein [Prolixibacteraceae bacterium]|nr:alpha/beta hydrolase-fold protein [Prolixibacteraceae bacterium]